MSVRKEHHRHSRKVTRTKRWKALRAEILERDGYRCQSCGCGGRLEVDHIKPVRTHPELSYEPRNLQALCPSCHTRKTRIECGHKPRDPQRDAWSNAVMALEGSAQRWSVPIGLRPSRVPITIVCGPPASGKTTFVNTHAAPEDSVIDFDDCLRSVGGRAWDTDQQKVKAAFALRDSALRELSRSPRRPAWFIVSAPHAQERAAWLRALGRRARCVVLTTDAETCKSRIAADPEREHARAKMCAAVDSWWATYAASCGAIESRKDKRCSNQ
jgi:predicted kinase